ncbi:hypothetical protein [Sphaerisporangium corydalis]|uniref:Uncharacterized protein n=1 Tax=Sphaerisporangium corydalis TaxID=1441875 RepID=A0ABV9EKI1_9ACTN|nr:hypothetical protein [Sphaerisporangium corydalis]
MTHSDRPPAGKHRTLLIAALVIAGAVALLLAAALSTGGVNQRAGYPPGASPAPTGSP